MPTHQLTSQVIVKGITSSIQATIQERTGAGSKAPGLAVILIGNDPASQIYVKNKLNACHNVGINSHHHKLDLNTTETELLKLIDTLNHDPDVHGILVQLPLPKQINTKKIIESIAPEKDVDGFHPYNLGRLAQGNPTLRPCTPYGIIQLLKAYDISLAGKNVVVIGASNIVGRPMAFEALLEKATVTICHSNTKNLENHVANADIIIVCTGRYNVVKVNWLKTHQIIIDVGIHRKADGSLHGDVDFENAAKRVAAITPVPGGVGPMTIVSLLRNTCTAWINATK